MRALTPWIGFSEDDARRLLEAAGLGDSAAFVVLPTR